MDGKKPRKRKNYPEYTRAKSRERREVARANGKCDSLCGKDVTPGLSPRTQDAYRSCESCRKRQANATRRKKAVKKLTKTTEETITDPGAKFVA